SLRRPPSAPVVPYTPLFRSWLRVEAHWTWYRRYWRSSLYSSGLQPVLFLAAMGLGFGSQVEAGPATGGHAYVHYVAPALLVAGADRKSTRLNSSHVKISYAV